MSDDKTFDSEYKNYYDNPIEWTSQFYFCPLCLRLDTYRGCSHACLYCFANNSLSRETGALSKGNEVKQGSYWVQPTTLNAVKKIFEKADDYGKGKISEDKIKLLGQNGLAIKALSHKMPLHWGGMSDPFQPAEKHFRISLQVLKYLKQREYPVAISTKGRIILEDNEYFDIIKSLKNVIMQFTIITDDDELRKKLEPNASTIDERFKMMKMFSDAGIPVVARIQPVIPMINEEGLKTLIPKLASVGVKHVAIEGMKYFTSNPEANKHMDELLGKPICNYYKSIGVKPSGNDLELPSWRKWTYLKIAIPLIHQYGMTYGAADNDFHSYGDTECCCGVDRFEGFHNIQRHNITSLAFKAKCAGCKELCYKLIKDEWYPSGTYRTNKPCTGKTKGIKEWDRVDYKTLFMDEWNGVKQHCPAELINIKPTNRKDEDGNLIYEFKTEEEVAKALNKPDQKTLGDF